MLTKLKAVASRASAGALNEGAKAVNMLSKCSPYWGLWHQEQYSPTPICNASSMQWCRYLRVWVTAGGAIHRNARKPKFSMQFSPMCVHCAVVGYVNHFLLVCSCFCDERATLLGTLRRLNAALITLWKTILCNMFFFTSFPRPASQVVRKTTDGFSK